MVDEALWTERDRRYQERFESQNTAIQAAMLAAEKAVDKAERATEKRFEGVNEFRQALSDQSKLFATRAELSNLSERLRFYESKMDAIEGRASGAARLWGILLGCVGLIGGLIAIFATR